MKISQGRHPLNPQVGTFIRSDIPGADLDCDGARASLEFAQETGRRADRCRTQCQGIIMHNLVFLVGGHGHSQAIWKG